MVFKGVDALMEVIVEKGFILFKKASVLIIRSLYYSCKLKSIKNPLIQQLELFEIILIIIVDICNLYTS